MRAIVVGMVVALVAVWSIPDDEAEAAVLCARKGKVKVRASACKPKEEQVQDIEAVAGDVADQTTKLPGLDARKALLAAQFQVECLKAPNLVLSDDPAFSFEHFSADCQGGCRKHDGNQTACEGAYAISEDGATSCFFFRGLCLPCADCGDRRASGACTNACITPPPCPGDSTRTVFHGFGDACRAAATQVDCEKTYHRGRGGIASCFWDGSECRGCGFRKENTGVCTNTCSSVSCADSTRTTRQRCRDFDGDAGACATTWYRSGRDEDTAVSCYHDGSNCRPCVLRDEVADRCDNSCRAGS